MSTSVFWPRYLNLMFSFSSTAPLLLLFAFCVYYFSSKSLQQLLFRLGFSSGWKNAILVSIGNGKSAVHATTEAKFQQGQYFSSLQVLYKFLGHDTVDTDKGRRTHTRERAQAQIRKVNHIYIYIRVVYTPSTRIHLQWQRIRKKTNHFANVLRK